MDAFEIDKILQAQIKTGQEFKAPEISKIKPGSASPNLILDIHSAEINQSKSSFPWTGVVIFCGVIILGIFLISIIPRSNNYQVFSKKDEREYRIKNFNIIVLLFRVIIYYYFHRKKFLPYKL